MKKLNLLSVLSIGFVAGVVWVAACGGGSTIREALATLASEISYINTTSGLSSTTVQDAVDELAAGERTDAQIMDLAVDGMGDEANTNALNHDRYTDAEAVTAIKAADGAGSTIDADTLDGIDSGSFVRDTGDTVTGNVTVSGNVTATNLGFGAAKTGYVSVAGVAFIPARNTDADATYDFSTDGQGARTANGTANFFAPVYLPNGAAITDLTVYMYDNSGDGKKITLSLQRYLLDGSAALDTLASLDTSDRVEAASFVSQSDSSIDNATVDNTTYTYLLKAAFSAASANLKVASAKITYTYTSL